MYGTQTLIGYDQGQREFENDVKMYGTQTLTSDPQRSCSFENDVKMYGTQTARLSGLRCR